VSVNSSSSFLTIGPTSAISVRDAGSTRPSDSSCRPPTTSWNATSSSTAVVSEKNGFNEILSAPRANATPNAAASARPTSAPAHSSSPLELNCAAARNTAVSKPSRTTITNPNAAIPSAPRWAPRASPVVISSFMRGAARHIQIVSVSTNTAPTSMPTPSTISSL